jgi:hypothetical protein
MGGVGKVLLLRQVLCGLLLSAAALGCQREELGRARPSALPALPSINVEPAPVLDDALSVELRSSDEMIRYRAAARAFQELEPSAVSAPAREALLGMTADPNERAGVRLWAARAAAKLEPARALQQFVSLASTGNAVDDEAWIILGPVALPHLSAHCRPDGCPLLVLTQIALIVSASSSHPTSRATLPLLLLESTRSDQARALVYRALGSFGADLAPELERLQQHEDATVAAAASQALAAIQ